MWRGIVPVAAVACIAMPASAKVYAVKFEPTVSQVSRYDQGTQIIDSYKQLATVRVVEVAAADKKSSSFMVIVLNTSRQSFVFGPASVVIRPAGTQPLSLITYEQAMQAERSKQKHEKFWAVVGAFGRYQSADSAGSEDGSGTYQGTNGSGTYSYSGENSAAQAIARRSADQAIDQDRAALEAKWARRDNSRSKMLRQTTVDPGAMYGGTATFAITDELRKAGTVPVTVEVNVEGEKHIFVARLSAD